MGRCTKVVIFAAVTAAALPAPGSGAAESFSYWRYTLSGTQVMRWEYTEHLDTAPDQIGPCDIDHRGEDTIRFRTPGSVRIRLGPDYTAVTESQKAGTWRKLVPLVGTETRVHTVVSAPADFSVCANPAAARREASACSGTLPLVKDTVGKVFVIRRERRTEMYVPFGYGFQPYFPDCHPGGFDITQGFLFPLFTYGAYAPLHGGSFTAPHARISARLVTPTQCLQNWPDTAKFTKCSSDHDATVTASWQMTFSR